MCSIDNILSITCLDVISKSSLVLIAIANLLFAISTFRIKDKKDQSEKECDRKISWLKSLIIDQTIEHFYNFFDSLETELCRLKETGLNDNEKKSVDENIGIEFIHFRRKFIDLFLAVDLNLYTEFLHISDDLQKHITDTIFDSGINLSYMPKFDEVMSEKISSTKTDLIKIIFNYRG